MQVDLTALIVALIGILASVVTIYVIPILKAKVGAEKWYQLLNIARVVVNAAEQLGFTEVIDDKLDYAMDQIKKMLKEQGLVYDDNTIRSAIESAVLNLGREISTYTEDHEYTVDELIKLKEAGFGVGEDVLPEPPPPSITELGYNDDNDIPEWEIPKG